MTEGGPSVIEVLAVRRKKILIYVLEKLMQVTECKHSGGFVNQPACVHSPLIIMNGAGPYAVKEDVRQGRCNELKGNITSGNPPV